MKAAQLEKYAKDFTLQVNEIPVPEIGVNDVLVKVKTAAVNPVDSLIGTGSLKLIQDYEFPLTMGNELTGIIEKRGSKVTDIQLGEAVYTRLPVQKIGAFAEYVVIDSGAVAPLPGNLDLITGAGVPLTGLTAYQGLYEELEAKPGKTLFIAGGSGSFGQMAVPLAKYLGLKVIVSGNTNAKERTLALGADQYLDYHNENYWEKLADVDYVIDALGPNEFDHELSIIKQGGRLLSLRTGPNKRFAVAHHFSWAKQKLFSLAGAKFDKKAAEKNVEYHFIFVRSNGSQLKKITQIIEENNLIPTIDPTEFHIEDINDAFNLIASGKAKEKVVIRF